MSTLLHLLRSSVKTSGKLKKLERFKLIKFKRGCQNVEAFEDCTTREYEKTIMGQCGCMPLTLKRQEEVVF